jgi:HK97 family phage major capsid protein
LSWPLLSRPVLYYAEYTNLGIDHWTGVLVQDAGGDIPADILHKAKTKVIVQTYGNYTPNVVMMHPNDEERLTLDKDGNTNYRFGGPEVDHVRTIWGMIPVVHPAVTEGEPIVGDITQAELYVREGVNVSVTDSHADFFTKGKLMWLASGRFAFAVLQPMAFCQVSDFDS